jgi:hypothetical protein
VNEKEASWHAEIMLSTMRYAARIAALAHLKRATSAPRSVNDVICSAGSMTRSDVDVIIAALAAAGYVITPRVPHRTPRRKSHNR